jgi:hypothetical protein
MTGSEMREIRRRFRMERADFAKLIGYTGTDRNNELRVKRLENAGEPVPLYIARLVWLIAIWARGHNQLPDFPEWPGYEFDHAPDPGHKEETNGPY